MSRLPHLNHITYYEDPLSPLVKFINEQEKKIEVIPELKKLQLPPLCSQSKDKTVSFYDEVKKKYKNMSDISFWDFIQSFNWHDRSDQLTNTPPEDRIKLTLEPYDADTVEAYRKQMKYYYNKLKEVISNLGLPILRDPHIDLILNHIIAKGQNFYDNVIMEPSLAMYIAYDKEYVPFNF